MISPQLAPQAPEIVASGEPFETHVVAAAPQKRIDVAASMKPWRSGAMRNGLLLRPNPAIEASLQRLPAIIVKDGLTYVLHCAPHAFAALPRRRLVGKDNRS